MIKLNFFQDMGTYVLCIIFLAFHITMLLLMAISVLGYDIFSYELLVI